MKIVMGTPAKYDLIIDQGSTLRVQATWVNPDNSPIDITGYRVLFQIRREANSSTALLSFDSHALTPGQSLGTLGISGTIAISISDEITALLPAEICVWDMLLENPAGVRDKFFFGRAIIRPTVTR